MSLHTIRLGTRGSALALWQTAWVSDALRVRFPGVAVETVVIRVESDRQPELPISAMASRGVFTRDIEVALLEGRIDAAVHSLKDLPSDDAPGLAVVATSPREDPRDALLTPDGRGLMDLPPGAVVGTSSLRRTALLREARSDLSVRPIRGNIDTRIRKLREGEYDAVVMAAAALNRLDEAVPARPLPPDEWVPAVAQGIIGVQARGTDAELASMLGEISDRGAMVCASIERSFLRALRGGCSVPVGGLARLEGGMATLHAFVGSPDGRRVLRVRRSVRLESAAALGGDVAYELQLRGAGEILDGLRAVVPIVRGPT